MQVAEALKFQEGTVPLTTLRAATEHAWGELRDDDAFRASLIARDPGLGGLFATDRSPYEIRAASAGIEPIGTAILIAVGSWVSQVSAGVAQEIVLDAWREVILPRIRERLGSDAVGSEEEDE